LNNLLFHIVYLASKLPLGALYIISDIIFFVNYYIIGYRKKIVYENLKNSFPNKSEKEIKQIQKKLMSV